jgi:hypothetical protein
VITAARKAEKENRALSNAREPPASGGLAERMEELEATVAAMQQQLSHLAQEQLMGAGAGSKRPLPITQKPQVEEDEPEASEHADERAILARSWTELFVGLHQVLRCGSETALKKGVEAATGLAPGTVDASQELTAKWKRSMKKALKVVKEAQEGRSGRG